MAEAETPEFDLSLDRIEWVKEMEESLKRATLLLHRELLEWWIVKFVPLLGRDIVKDFAREVEADIRNDPDLLAKLKRAADEWWAGEVTRNREKSPEPS